MFYKLGLITLKRHVKHARHKMKLLILLYFIKIVIYFVVTNVFYLHVCNTSRDVTILMVLDLHC